MSKETGAEAHGKHCDQSCRSSYREGFLTSACRPPIVLTKKYGQSRSWKPGRLSCRGNEPIAEVQWFDDRRLGGRGPMVSKRETLWTVFPRVKEI